MAVKVVARIVQRNNCHKVFSGTEKDTGTVLHKDEQRRVTSCHHAEANLIRTWKSLLTILLLAAVGAAVNAFTPENAMAQELAQQHSKQLDVVFAPLTNEKSPGLAVLVRKDGQTVFERGYGARELRTHSRIGAHTNFRLASFTKQFTAAAIMLLVHDKQLTYDKTLTQIFPDFPAYGKDITVRNLLNHTGGLPDYEDLMDAFEKANGPTWRPEHQIQDDEVLALLKKETMGKFAPGTSWSYSNSGYVVLGLIVAKVSGKSYGEFLQERILAPLKMDRTIAFQKTKNEVAERAFGHSKKAEAFDETDQSATSATLGDGGIYSNLEDLAKWDDAIRNHTLLTTEEMLPAVTPAKLADGSDPRWPAEPHDDNLHPGKLVLYGFGWFLDPFEHYARMWHTGSTRGFRTVIERFTDENITIIILCNRTDLDPEKLALQVVNMFLETKK
jgi:CubicO group peptidase (beta-lactamase class C family)